jgi:ADP-heptose:LPS heptosyltransferase
MAVVAPIQPTPLVDGPTVVVLRALGLGDFLTAVPALRGVAAAFPEHRRVLATPASLRPLVHLLGGAVHGIVDTDYRRGFVPLPPALRGADIAVNLHGHGPQSHDALVQAGARRLLAYRHPDVPASAGGPDWNSDEHEVDRWCRLLHSHGITADPTHLALEVLTASTRRVTIVHPGTKAPARRWPAARWAAVARALAAAGHDVAVTGGADEVDLAREVATRADLPASAVLAGRTDLRRLTTLVVSARLVLCGDTGIAHLATALRTPSVIVFGPISPARWGPRIDPDLHRVLWNGRVGNPHAALTSPGLLAITPAMVLDEAEKLMDDPGDVK